MVASKETAEEQLLRMIEGSSGPAPTAKRPGAPAPWLRLLERLREAASRARQTLMRPRLGKAPADPFLWQLQLAGRLAWIVLAGLGLYVVADMVLMKPTLPRLAVPLASGGGSAGGAEGGQHAVPDPLETNAAAYRETLASRNPFRLATERLIDDATGQTVKNRLVELTGGLVIVGINRGRVPEALIEHTEEKRTYFVKVGDTINGVKVTAIDQRGVTVAYEGEELILQ